MYRNPVHTRDVSRSGEKTQTGSPERDIMTTYLSTPSKAIDYRTATEDELTLLGQIVDVDGNEDSIVNREPVRNGSGRLMGEHLTITDEAAEFIAESIRQMAEIAE